jgi:hypothetical protein
MGSPRVHAMFCGQHWHHAVFDSLAPYCSQGDCALGHILPKHDSDINCARASVRCITNDGILGRVRLIDTPSCHSYLNGFLIFGSFYTMAMLKPNVAVPHVQLQAIVCPSKASRPIERSSLCAS